MKERRPDRAPLPAGQPLRPAGGAKVRGSGDEGPSTPGPHPSSGLPATFSPAGRRATRRRPGLHAKPRKLGAALALALTLLAGRAVAVEPNEVLPDPALEARARSISAELRCLVCQNQSIDDSHADLARDLRLLVRERLKAGDSDDAVERYLVARYGDFVLLKPPFERETVLLWSLPFLLLGAGAAGIALARHATPRRTVLPLSPAEEEELAGLVGRPTVAGHPSDSPKSTL